MKKRKRKMEENKVKCSQVAFLISSSLLIPIINSLFPSTNCQTVTTHFDEEHHRLNLSQSNSSSNWNIMQTDLSSTRLLNYSSRVDQANYSDTSLISQQQRQQNINKNEILNDNSLDNDLLAVESSRSLSVGAIQRSTAQLSARDQQTNPPYASNISTSTSPSSAHYSRLNGSSSQLSPTTLQPLNDTYLLKLYRATNLPSFIREHQQNRNALIETSKFQTKSQSTHQVTSNHANGLKYPAQQSSSYQQASNLPLPITSSWHSLYFSPFAVAKQTGRPATTVISDHQSKQDVKNYTQHNDDYIKPNLSYSNNAKVSAQLEQEGPANVSEPNRFVTPTPVTDFPSLISSSGDKLEEEQQFERTLALGNYHRTNARNMSWSQLLRQATESNVMESLMVTNKSIVSLLCDTNDMLIRLKFKQPFTGSVMTNLDRNKSCRLLGTGGYYYEMRISLNDCGTRQEMSRLFINNILIQFNDSSYPNNHNLDLVENEIKTIICSYPIKPRAPPPPDLPTGLSERIIEQAVAPSEPARLVYYEPLVLISGLLFLSLTLLGLTMSAYMFAKRFRGSKSNRVSLSNRSNLPDGSRDGGFSSSRIYRNSPSQVSNFLLAPPLIVSEDNINKNRKQSNRAITQRKSVKSYKTIADRRRGGTTSVERYSNDRFSRGQVTLTKIGTKDDGAKEVAQTGFPTINLNPNDSPDSLADKNDKSSVTTIEIPFSTKTKSRSEHVNNLHEPVGFRTKLVATSDSSEEIQANTGARMVDGSFKKGTKSTSPTPLPPQSRPKPNEGDEKVDDNKINKQTTFTRSKKKSSFYKTEHRLTKAEYPNFESKEVQAGGDTPPFGSLRSKLTSPKEFKRLQEITRMFEEMIVATGNDDATVAHKINLKPSKYKSKILDTVEESERRLLANMLTKDELFRSLVVDSVNLDTFNRKLKESSTYGKRFSESTWKLLEEILLDPDITSGVDSSSITNHIDSSSYSETENKNLADHKRLTSSNQENMKQHLVVSQKQLVKKQTENSSESAYYNKESKLDNQVTLSKTGDDQSGVDNTGSNCGDDESVLVEIDANHSDSQLIEENDDSLNSDDSNFLRLANPKSPRESPKLVAKLTTLGSKIQHKDTVRVSQFNSTTKEGGMTGTLINIDSVTNFTNFKDFDVNTSFRMGRVIRNLSVTK